ncbi:MAG: tetratricopeptide repeat protein, partial [Chloroflexota bacterium]
FRDERDAALESYQKALGLYSEIGAKLGEANVLQAIGDVQQFRDERDAALESYQKALGLYSEIGDRLGEANTLQSMGKLAIQNAKDQEGFQEGMKILQTAMGIYEEIEDKVGQINILMFLVQIMAAMGENEKAAEIANQVLPMLVEVAGENHPVTEAFRGFIAQL